jgi:hypothetical protein
MNAEPHNLYPVYPNPEPYNPADMNAEPPNLEGAKYPAEAYPLAISKELVAGDAETPLRSTSFFFPQPQPLTPMSKKGF